MGTPTSTDSERFRSLQQLKEWCDAAPPGTQLDAAEVAAVLDNLGMEPSLEEPGEPEVRAEAELSWRSKLWMVAADTRLGTKELTEALDRPASFIYERTQSEADDPIPHRKLGGTLVFRAGEIRAWVRETEEVLVAGPSESTDAEKRGNLELAG